MAAFLLATRTDVAAAADDTPKANSPAAVPAGLSAADWAGIRQQLPMLAQQAYLKASDTRAGDQFGVSASVYGDTVVVGAPSEDSTASGVNGNQDSCCAYESGAVYVFVRNGGEWTQQAYLKASNSGAGDAFGRSVSISGDTLVVGAWLEDSAAAGVNGNGNDNSLENSGAAYVFVRQGTNWTQQAYLKASNAGRSDVFGCSVSVSGDTVVVGAFGEDSSATGVNGSQTNNSGNESGAAYMFTRSGTNWTQEAYLKASNTGGADFFGGSVAVSGGTVVVGAQGESSNASGVNGAQNDNSLPQSGAAYVFSRTGTNWTQQAYLKASNPAVLDHFGESVAISGEALVIGAPFEDGGAIASGAAYVFVRDGNGWAQQALLKASNAGNYDNFGLSVALSEDTLVIGAAYEASSATGVNSDQSDNRAPSSGAAYVFVRDGTNWAQRAYLKGSNTRRADEFGASVAVSGGTVLVGARVESSSATGVNGSQCDNGAVYSGAAYVFDPNAIPVIAPAEIVVEQSAGAELIDGNSVVDFGVALPGTRTQRTFSIRNTGTVDLTGLAVTMTGPDTGRFAVTNGPGPFVRGPCGSTTFTVAFTPDTIGDKTATLHITSNDSGESPFDIELTGLGVAPIPEIAVQHQMGTNLINLVDGSSALDFESEMYCGRSQRTFIIRNVGYADLTGLAVTMDGVNASDFTLISSPASPLSGFGGNTSFSVAFTARGPGARTAELHIASNDTDEPSFDIPLTGPGATPPEIAVEQPPGTGLTNGSATIDFGPALVSGTSQRTFTFTIRNRGDTTLAVMGVTITGPNAGDFAIQVHPYAQVSGPCGSTTFTVNFSPTDAGARDAILHIASDDSDESSFDIALTGTGVTPLQIAQRAYVKASNTGENDGLGNSVAISGATMVVGAPYEDGVGGVGAGAAYVFVRNGDVWTQQAYLKASNPGSADYFGGAVAISGDTLVIGALGEDSNATGVNGNPSDNRAQESGAAYVFVRNGTNWSQQAYLKASNTGAGDQFGSSVVISGDTVVIAASLEDSNATGVNGNQSNNLARDSGATYIFVRSGTNWSQQAYLKASNTGAADYFGSSVAISGDTVVIASPWEDSSARGVNGDQANNQAFNSGATYVFVREGTNWSQQAYLKASNPGWSYFFGSSVAVSGDTVVVGASGEDSGATGVNGNQGDYGAYDSGAAYVFVRDGTNWIQQAYLKPFNTDTGDGFGASVAIQDNIVVVGAPGEDSTAIGTTGDQSDNSAADSGAAYLFLRSGTNWTPGAYLKASNTGRYDQFGWSVAVANDTVIVGATGEDGSATGINGDSCNNLAPGSGAAYVFDRTAVLVTGAPEIEVAMGSDLTDGAATVDFGFTVVSQGSGRTFTIRNTGLSPLTGLDFAIDGPDASDFTVSSASTSISGCDDITFTVSFSASIAGVKTAALHITSNDSDESPFDIMLQGVAANSQVPVGFTSASYSVSETSAVALVTVERGGSDIDLPLTIGFMTWPESARPGEDYLEQRGMLEFAPGETNKVIAIPILDDAQYEGTEAMYVSLDGFSSPGVILGEFNQCRIEIRDNERVGFVSSFHSVSETDGTLVVAVERAGDALSQRLFLDYGTSGGWAQPGEDYVEQTGTLEFAPGETNKLIAISLLNDAFCEGNEQFVIWLNSTSAIPEVAQCTVEIRDNDGFIEFGEQSFFALETNGLALIRVVRSGDSAAPVSVQYSANKGLALAGQDYVPQSGTIVFAPGETNHTIAITILDDPLVDETKYVQIELSHPTGEICLGNSAATLTIQDNEQAGDFSFSLACWEELTRVGEEQGSVTLTVFRAGESSQSASVNYQTSDGTATAGADYAARSGTLTFGPLEVMKTITVPIRSDGLVEADKRFNVTLASPSIARPLNCSNVVVTILDDDRPGSLDLSFAPELWIPGVATVMAPHPDGGVLVWSASSNPGRLFRLGPDGKSHPSFVAGGAVNSWRSQITAMAVRPDGKTLLGGFAPGFHDFPFPFFYQLNADGSEDTNFVSTVWLVNALALQPDGTVLVSGSSVSGPSRPGGGEPILRRLKADGSHDADFTPAVIGSLLGLQPGGKILVHGPEGIVQLNPDGSLNTNFQRLVDFSFRALAPDGRFFGITSSNTLARLHADGSLDPSFTPDVDFPWPEGPIAVQANGKIVTGAYVEGTPTPGYQIFRINADGSRDRSFDVGGNLDSSWSPVLSGFLMQPDGQILVAGGFHAVNGVVRSGLARLNGDRNYMRLAAPSWQPGGALRVTFNTQPGLRYTLQASVNLKDWVTLQTQTASGHALVFEDPTAPLCPYRFYRALRVEP